jgi:hypothetical protein
MELKTHKTILHSGIMVTEATLALVERDKYNGSDVGKTVFPVKSDFSKTLRQDGNFDMITPVLFDEIGIRVGDWELHVGKWLHKRTQNTSYNSDCYKRVIVLPNQLPDGFIDMIAEGRLKNGDKFLVECEESGYCLNGTECACSPASHKRCFAECGKIKFDGEGNAIVHFEEKKYTFDQLLKYQTGKGYNAVDFQTKNSKQKLEKWFDINRP